MLNSYDPQVIAKQFGVSLEGAQRIIDADKASVAATAASKATTNVNLTPVTNSTIAQLANPYNFTPDDYIEPSTRAAMVKSGLPQNNDARALAQMQWSQNYENTQGYKDYYGLTDAERQPLRDSLNGVATSQAGNLPTSQVGGLPTSQVSSLDTSQVGGLPTSQISSLGTSQVGGLPTSQVSSLDTSQVGGLPTTGIPALTTADLAAWGKTLPQSITSEQLSAALKSQQDANQTALTTQNADFLKNWNTSADTLKNDILSGVDAKNQAFGTQATKGFMDAFKNFQIPTNQQTGVNLGNYNDNRNAAADQWWSQYVTGRR
jgi:hypothetical protein